MEFDLLIHEEDGVYWAEVKELPGCFASGRDLEELKEAAVEAITLYLADGSDTSQKLPDPSDARVAEMRVKVPA